MARTESYIANYRVIVEPDEELGTGKRGFTAYVPKLGIADSGYTVEEALKNVKEGIRCYLEALLKESQLLPEPDRIDQDLVTTASVVIPLHLRRRIKTAAAVSAL